MKSPRRIMWTAIGALLSAAVGNPAALVGQEDPMARGITAFEDYYFYEARDAFADAVAADPSDAGAAYAYARALHIVHDYEEAIPALERALALEPDDPRIHAELVRALAWGGVFRGRRDWYDRSMGAAERALARFPDLVEVYRQIEFVSQETQSPELPLEMYARIASEAGASPIFQVQRLIAQLAVARSDGDAEATASVTEALDAFAAQLEAREGSTRDDEQAAADRYALLRAASTVGDQAATAAWLDRLEESDIGRRFAAEDRHFTFFREFNQLRQEPDAAWDLLQQWRARFPTSWDSDHFSRQAAAGQQLLTVYWMEMQRRGGLERPLPSPTILTELTEAEIVRRVVPFAIEQARLGVSSALGVYGFTARELLRMGDYGEEVLYLVDIAQERIDAGENMTYPGQTTAEREDTDRNNRVAFDVFRGRALHALGRDEEAGPLLRNAVQEAPRADRFEALADFLADRGETAPAYRAYVAALGWNEVNQRLADADAVRERAMELGADVGIAEAEVVLEIKTAADWALEALRRQIVERRLDLPAPSFALTDTTGRQWRLEDLAGRVVVLNYWATWCGPCRQEAPHYAALVEEYADVDDVVFLAVSTDADRSDVGEFLAEQELTYTVLYDEGTGTDLHITGIPTHLILDRAGRIQYRTGGFGDAESYAREMRWRIDALREEGGR